MIQIQNQYIDMDVYSYFNVFEIIPIDLVISIRFSGVRVKLLKGVENVLEFKGISSSSCTEFLNEFF